MLKKQKKKPPFSFAASLFLLLYLLFSTGGIPGPDRERAESKRPRFLAAGASRPTRPRPNEESETVIEIAKSQIGNGPNEVGEDLQYPPYNLSRRLRKNEQWCSEFVSWVYCAAGAPLGERRRGWLMRNSRSLRRWFEINTFFVEREDDFWKEHDPAPGDYIRYNNDRGGHSGLVYSVEGGTLVTIEGNIGNRVVVKRLTKWRTRSDIDGIGLKTTRATAAYAEYRKGRAGRKVERARKGNPRS